MIPLNFKEYYKKFQELTDAGTISTKNQIASPLSAGARGLARLEKFADSPNQIMRGSVTEGADRQYQTLDKKTIEKLGVRKMIRPLFCKPFRIFSVFSNNNHYLLLV